MFAGTAQAGKDRAAWVVACMLCGHFVAWVSASEPLRRVELLAVQPVSGEVRVATASAGPGRLLLVDDGGPIAWCDELPPGKGERAYRCERPIPQQPAGEYRAWLVAPDLVAALLPRWPRGGALRGRVENVGLGAAGAWVNAGRNQGIQPGDAWWRREGGQPTTLFQVRLVADSVCYVSVTPLVSDWRLEPGAEIELWPRPDERRRKRCTSAVSHVGPDGETRVWVAAPPPGDWPAEPHIDFFRDGKYVGYGVLERRDELFWYVRPLERACVEPLRVGDEAVIRTTGDIKELRFAPRVFAGGLDGWLITAGEGDGLRPGMKGEALRAGSPLANVEVARVQADYSIVRIPGALPASQPAASASASQPMPPPLAAFDEIRFAPPAAPAERVGRISRAVGRDLFVAEWAGATDAAGTGNPLALRDGPQTIGVAVILKIRGGSAMGFVIEESQAGPLRSGCDLFDDHE